MDTVKMFPIEEIIDLSSNGPVSIALQAASDFAKLALGVHNAAAISFIDATPISADALSYLPNFSDGIYKGIIEQLNSRFTNFLVARRSNLLANGMRSTEPLQRQNPLFDLASTNAIMRVAFVHLSLVMRTDAILLSLPEVSADTKAIIEAISEYVFHPEGYFYHLGLLKSPLDNFQRFLTEEQE